ncbi:HD domain-containing protein [Oscillibacter sp.]|uniref:CCA tRNA nucleotidyltransferase n=1 Tax=Oscillibacter sp. TaxID=1945593 RepID=UPI0026396CD6|nr:HD domain-containing protein [Oscillibacter sp.]MDD3347722.1 HD domain-containing protein [Oscillibacter sp.]
MENLPEFVRDVLERLEAAGYEAWCVGGCVRDSLLGRTPLDWDVTTAALPDALLELFGKQAVPTGLEHGTVTVLTKGNRVEVTTYRVDGAYRDHRRPVCVTFTPSLEEDLGRRDFTVNAMAMDLRGTFCDPFHGKEDLRRGLLRCVGEPDRRFAEDALRILRGVRFSATLGFAVEDATAAGIHKNRELLRGIAAERVQTEFLKLLTGEKAAQALREFPDVAGVFWPEVLAMVGFDQRNRHHCYDVWEHTLHALEEAAPDLVLRCAVLLHDVGKPPTFLLDAEGHGHFRGHQAVGGEMADGMLRRLKCSNDFRQTVVRLVEWHDRNIFQGEKSLRRALRVLGERDLRRLLAIKRADNLAQAPAFHGRQKEIELAEKTLEELLTEDACFSLKQLAVHGKDLLELGLKGPAVGRTLNALLDRVVEGDAPNERTCLLELARLMAQEGQ